MRRDVARLMLGAILALTAFAAPSALAQSETLRKAIDLYDRQDYAAAQQEARRVDRNKLSESEKAEYDQLMELLGQALAGRKQAETDIANADRAFNAGNYDEADRMYQAVVTNAFATQDQKVRAHDQQNEIIRRRGMRGTPPAPAAPGVPGSGGATSSGAPIQVINLSGGGSGGGAPATPAGPERLTVVDEMRRRDDLLWQRAVAQMQDRSTKAREAVAQENYEDARRLAQEAVQLIEGARSYAEPASKYEDARAEADALVQYVEDSYEFFQAQRAETQRQDIVERIEQRRAIQEAQRLEKIEQLFQTAAQLRKEQKFAESADVLKQILFIDPSNAKAQYQLELAEDFASFAEQRQLDTTQGQQFRRTMSNAYEALIPWDYEVLYPRNWLELTARRQGAAAGIGTPEEDRELNRRLDEVLPEVRFEETPFETVVEFLGDIKKVNLAVDWEDLESNAIERDKPVTVKLSDLAFRTVLKEVLGQVGGDVNLSFAVTEGLIRVASKEKLDRDKNVLVYDIRDLLVNIPRFNNAPRIDPSQALAADGGGDSSGGRGSSNIFEDNEEEDDTGDTGGRNGIGDPALVAEIMDIIRQTVEPDSWRESGGGDGSLRELNGNLIVYNTSDAHRQVTDLLTQLRATRSLQIALETRFLTVSSNYLEEIGVDLDFVLNSGSADYDRAYINANGVPNPVIDPFTGATVLVPRQFTDAGAFANPAGFGQPLAQQGGILQSYGNAAFVPQGTGVVPQFNNMTPIPISQGSLGLTNPSNFNTQVPGSLAERVGLNPALNIAGSFLDNLQVDFLVRATQANARSSVVQAPRLMMFNGQRANISVGRARQFVSNLRPQLAEGVAAVAPVIGAAFSGTSLDVEGTISADRNYVTITVRTSQLREPNFQQFRIQQQSGNSPGLFINLLDQEFSTINTTVSIPDGGTVMLGGQKQVGEIEVEAGVPILSKIPVLKRAFTNSTTIKDTQTLLILIKTKIIIQEETEEEAFPTFSSAEAGG